MLFNLSRRFKKSIKSRIDKDKFISVIDRGAKSYDKFVVFVENLTEVGKYIDKSQEASANSFKQLSRRNDTLILQTTELKT